MNAISLISVGVEILHALQGGAQPKARSLQQIFLEEELRHGVRFVHHHCCPLMVQDTVALSGDDDDDACVNEQAGVGAQGGRVETDDSDLREAAEACGKAAQGVGAKLAAAPQGDFTKSAGQAKEARAANHASPFSAIAQAERNGGGKPLTRALDAYISVMARQAETRSRMSGGVTSGLA